MIGGIGVDAVEIDRFRATLARTPSMVERLFSDGERADAARRPDPTERLAVRFAAKEAVMKALGVGLGAIDFRDVEVSRADSGEPSLVITGRAAELAAAQGVVQWHL
ncbi:MAG: acpS [Acidimicrobiia bacterium]|nr:acpS [Acidimicrobiia bacterium]